MRNNRNCVRWNRPFLILSCSLQTIYGILSMCFAVVLNTLASAINGEGDFFRAAILVILFGTLYPASRMLADSMTQTYGERAAEAVRSKLNRAIFSMNSADFADKDTGEYLNSMTGDVFLLKDQYYTQIPILFSYIAQFVFCVIYSFYLNMAIGALLMLMSIVQYVIPMLFGQKLNQLTTAQSQMTSFFISKAKELLLGFSVIKSYGAEKQTYADFDDTNASMTKARKKAAVMSRVMMCTNMFVSLAIIILSILLAGWFVERGTMSPAALITVFYISNRYMMPVMEFSHAYTQLKSSYGVRQKLNSFLTHHTEIIPVKSKPVTDGIEIKNINFAYREDAPALHNISFKFAMGKKYLITGESGCGKSTLLKILSGQYPCKGVYIDGTMLEDLPLGSLAGRLALVEQQPYVFRRSVANNIDFLKTGDHKRILKAAELCCLSDLIASLPDEIDTVIDEEQRQLSGGQKARIGLARALFTNPDVLLLDEVTSALDPDTARKIEQVVLSLENVLVIHVSHKPSSDLLPYYDAVLTMDSGRIVRVITNKNGK